MTLKHICAGLCVLFIIFSVANSSADMKDISPDIAQIQENISAVKNLMERVIKNYNKLEKLAIPASGESDSNTESENKQFRTDKGNKGRIFEVTTDYQTLNGRPPSSFSAKSKRETPREIEKTKTIDVSKENDDMRKLETDSKEYAIDTQIKLRNIEDDEESDEDETSSEVEDHDDDKENSKKKILLVHLGKGKPNQHINSAKIARQKYMTSNKPKREIKKKVTNKTAKSEEVNKDSLSEEDKAMESEVKKASYLRQAYADVCHQVIIRKCLRALRAVLKDVCSKSRKCSSKYKDDFREYGHEGCNQQFDNQKSACRMGLDIDEDTDSGKHERARHLDSKKQEREATAVKENETPEQAEFREVNILRDRFEKICKKTSFTKCRAACKHASDKTCKKHECVSGKKKALKKSCKSRCQETYAYKGGSDESDDDDENGSE